jgi:hypothetical protein
MGVAALCAGASDLVYERAELCAARPSRDSVPMAPSQAFFLGYQLQQPSQSSWNARHLTALSTINYGSACADPMLHHKQWVGLSACMRGSIPTVAFLLSHEAVGVCR